MVAQPAKPPEEIIVRLAPAVRLSYPQHVYFIWRGKSF